MQRPEILSSEEIYRGRVFRVRVDRLRYGGREIAREVVEHPGSVVILPLLDDRTLLLIRQYRHAVGEELVEAPAGTLEAGESPERCALRELEEETGYRAGRVVKFAEFYLAPGYSSERMHAFVAKELERGESRPEEDENISVIKVSVDEALKMVESGEIRDVKTIASILLYFRS